MDTSRNPYIDAPNVPTLKQSVVAFIDILGYRELVRGAEADSQSEALLLRLHGALKRSRRHVDPQESEDTLSLIRGKDFSAFRAFTDNIVIGYPIHDDGELQLGNAFDELSYFQMIMTIEGFFVRGGIAVGDLYMDDIVVYGSGLIDAYNAEAELARDPRIVLAPSAQQAVNQHLTYYSPREHSPQNRSLLRDSDDQYFVDYLSTTIAENGLVYEEELGMHKAKLEENLKVHKTHPAIWSKYVWAANYHNYFCDHNDAVNQGMRISQDLIVTSPTRLVERT